MRIICLSKTISIVATERWQPMVIHFFASELGQAMGIALPIGTDYISLVIMGMVDKDVPIEQSYHLA